MDRTPSNRKSVLTNPAIDTVETGPPAPEQPAAPGVKKEPVISAPGATASLPDLPPEVQLLVFATMLGSEKTSAPELSKSWAAVRHTSKEAGVLADRMAAETHRTHLRKSLAIKRRGQDLERSGAVIAESLKATADAQRSAWRVPAAISDAGSIRIPVMQIDPTDTAPVFKALKEMPGVTQVEFDLSARETVDEARPVRGSSRHTDKKIKKAALNQRIDSLCAVLNKESQRPIGAEGELALRLDGQKLNNSTCWL